MNLRFLAGALALAVLVPSAADAKQCGRLDRSRGAVVTVKCPAEGRAAKHRRPFRAERKAHARVVSVRAPRVEFDNSGRWPANAGAPVVVEDADAQGARRAGHNRAVRVARAGETPRSLIGDVIAPARFIVGRLACALNVNAALSARGIRGTGSAVAEFFLVWGHRSVPVPGAVAVFSRKGGGHVAIVDHVRPDGTVIYLNPSARRQAWTVGPYNRKPIAFRVSG